MSICFFPNLHLLHLLSWFTSLSIFLKVQQFTRGLSDGNQHMVSDVRLPRTPQISGLANSQISPVLIPQTIPNSSYHLLCFFGCNIMLLFRPIILSLSKIDRHERVMTFFCTQPFGVLHLTLQVFLITLRFLHFCVLKIENAKFSYRQYIYTIQPNEVYIFCISYTVLNSIYFYV